ncbi:SMC5-SMC6 complex localization factor protein 1 [Maublancomyces gigas]|uniref:SMC5-SMC6 complex localization factor protein 1 n=1 Tax=Discina gigas TaxID=1032678 RepID=A0ABR3GDT7_9PEZI
MSQPTQNQSTGNNIPISLSNGLSETMLITAVKRNDLAQVEALIRQGADVNTPDMFGWTPLHHAARRVNESIAFFLLRSGANIEARNAFLQTPLIVAATRVNSFEMVQYLLECGANIAAQDSQGNCINDYLTEEEMVCCRNR